MGKQKPLALRLGVDRHPDFFAKKVPSTAPSWKMAVGLDFGNQLGYAYCEYDPENLTEVTPCCGIWNLSPGEWDTGATRMVRLRQFLNIMQPDVIFYEDPRFNPPAEMRGMPAAKIIGRAIAGGRWLIAIHATVVTWAEERGIPAHNFKTAAIKKHATGKGNANKQAMVDAANEKWGFEIDLDAEKGADNEVDAAFALDLGMEVYREGL